MWTAVPTPSPHSCSQWKWRSHSGSPGTGPVLEETQSPWSVKEGKKKKLAWFPSSLMGTSSCSVQYLPVLLNQGFTRTSAGPEGLSTTLRSHDSSSLLPAPAQSRQKPCCLSSLRAKRPQGSQGQVDPRMAIESHLIPEQVPLPKPAFLQPTACCSPGHCPSTTADHPSGERGRCWCRHPLCSDPGTARQGAASQAHLHLR